ERRGAMDYGVASARPTISAASRSKLAALAHRLFGGLESDAAVRAVAVRLVRRAAATTESNGAAVFDHDLVALGIPGPRRSRQPIRTVRDHLDRRLRHSFLLERRSL